MCTLIELFIPDLDIINDISDKKCFYGCLYK